MGSLERRAPRRQKPTIMDCFIVFGDVYELLDGKTCFQRGFDGGKLCERLVPDLFLHLPIRKIILTHSHPYHPRQLSFLCTSFAIIEANRPCVILPFNFHKNFCALDHSLYPSSYVQPLVRSVRSSVFLGFHKSKKLFFQRERNSPSMTHQRLNCDKVC